MIAKRIILHCSDTDNGKDVSAETIRSWHVDDLGWNDIGYHIVIEVDGRVRRFPEIGRALNVPGAHVKGENQDSLGICLVGRDKFTAKQWEALRHTYDSLKTTLRINEHNVYCHNEFNKGKTCPGFRAGDVIYWLTRHDFKPLEKHLITHEGVAGWKSNALQPKQGDVMAKLKVEVEVSKEAHELGVGLAGVVDAVKGSLADGWHPGQDIPVILTSALTHLVPAVQGVDQLDEEMKEDAAAFARALSLGMAETLAAALKK